MLLRYISTIKLFSPQIFDDKTEKNILFAPSFMRSTLLSSLILHLECDTCDSKKNNIAVGRRALRVRARAFCPLLSPRFLLGGSANSPYICQVVIAKYRYFKGNLSLFCDFFPLWGNNSPYTYRGAPMICTSRFISTFTAKANPTYNPQSVIRPPPKRDCGKKILF